MQIETLLLFLPACFALNLAPGPNNLLSVANAARFGFLKAIVAGIGRLIAFVGMITLAASGLAVVLLTSEVIFYSVKLIGALYLFYLAVQLWGSEPATPATASKADGDLWLLAKQEFFVAAGNPKAILIFTAFLPQFLNPAEKIAPQFFLLGVIFLALEWIAIAAYALMGSHLREWFSIPSRQRVFNRTCAALLGSAGLGLLLSRRNASES
jgi:threonine/homoserine/homoserine lactone efflux protein